MLKLGIYPEKLYRATFIRQYGLCCCSMALVSFRLLCKNLGHLPEFIGQMVYRPPPPGKKIPVRVCRLESNFKSREDEVILFHVSR